MAGEPHDHWDGVYTARGEKDVSWFQDAPEPSLSLILKAAPDRSARVLDVGGGASRLVDALLDAGFGSVGVLDVAEAGLEAARRRLGTRAAQVDWIVADVTRWRPAEAWDVWHDRAVFHFLTEAADRAAYMEAVRSGLRPGGQVAIGTFAPHGPERCSGLPVRRYGAEDLAREFGTEFDLIEHQAQDHRTPAGAVQPFTWCRLRRL